MKKYKVGYTSGVFDLFHIGHLNILKRAKSLCDFLIVGVTTDELSMKRKNKLPIFSFEERCQIVGAIKYVDLVVPQTDMNKLSVVKENRVNVVFVGSDWKGTESWKIYEKEFAEIGTDVVYLEHTDGISSTILREKINVKK